jgi:hypothetical protein
MKNPSVVIPGMKAMLSGPDFLAVSAAELVVAVLEHAVSASAAAVTVPSTAVSFLVRMMVSFADA